MNKVRYLLLWGVLLSCGPDQTRLQQMVDQAIALEDQGAYDQAIAVYEQILKEDPDDFRSANSIAGLYGRKEAFAEEVRWGKRALALNPRSSLACINLGNGYAGLGDDRQAQYSYQEAARLDPSSAFPHYSLGVLAEKRGDLVAAMGYYTQAVKADPKFKDGYYNLAVACLNLRQYERALENINKVLALDPADEEAKAMRAHIRKAMTP